MVFVIAPTERSASDNRFIIEMYPKGKIGKEEEPISRGMGCKGHTRSVMMAPGGPRQLLRA